MRKRQQAAKRSPAWHIDVRQLHAAGKTPAEIIKLVWLGYQVKIARDQVQRILESNHPVSRSTKDTVVARSRLESFASKEHVLGVRSKYWKHLQEIEILKNKEYTFEQISGYLNETYSLNANSASLRMFLCRIKNNRKQEV